MYRLLLTCLTLSMASFVLAQSESNIEIEVQEEDGIRSIKIIKQINGQEKIIEWKGAGELPEAILEEMDEIEIHFSDEDGQGIEVIRSESSTQSGFLGVMLKKEVTITNDNGIESRIESISNILDDVVVDSPAEKAGLQAGDKIVKIGNTSVENHTDLLDALTEYEAGENVSISYERDGVLKETEAILAEAKGKMKRKKIRKEIRE